MSKIDDMSRSELIEFIEAAKRGEIKSDSIKVWYLEDDVLKLATLNGKYKETTPDQFLKKSSEKDVILIFKEVNYDKHPYLKDYLKILVKNKQQAKSLELFFKN